MEKYWKYLKILSWSIIMCIVGIISFAGIILSCIIGFFIIIGGVVMLLIRDPPTE